MKIFSQYQQQNQRPVNDFYKRFKQKVSCNIQDSIFIVSQSQNTEPEIIASLFIRPLDDMLILRSLFVDPTYRNQKIGSQLTQYALSNIRHVSNNIFCLCKSDLIEFYKNLGFIQSNRDIQHPYILTQQKKGLCLMYKAF